jgi:predicted Zn-dependent protease
MLRHLRFVVVVAALVVAFLGLSGARTPREPAPPAASAPLSVSDEMALGREVAPEAVRLLGGYDRDAAAQRFVAAVGARIVLRSPAKSAPFRFRFAVLAEKRVATALALPGGAVFVTRALLSSLEDEAQLAGILAHEVGHAVGRHASERLAEDADARALADGSDAAAIAQRVAAALATMSFGPRNEVEADVLAVDFMSDAGYDPRALLAVVSALSASGAALETAHPDAAAREVSIREEIARRYPGGVPDALGHGRTIAGRKV